MTRELKTVTAVSDGYWLRHCHGFSIESPHVRLGVVEDVLYGAEHDRPSALAVRGGLFGHRLERPGRDRGHDRAQVHAPHPRRDVRDSLTHNGQKQYSGRAAARLLIEALGVGARPARARARPAPIENDSSAALLAQWSSDIRRSVTVNRAVPNIKSDRPAETRDFFLDLLGFEVAMDMGWVVTVASPTNPSAQVTIIGNDDMAAPGISVEVPDVDAVHARAVERGLEIAYSLRDEEWGVRRFMVCEPSGTLINVVSHRSG